MKVFDEYFYVFWKTWTFHFLSEFWMSKKLKEQINCYSMQSQIIFVYTRVPKSQRMIFLFFIGLTLSVVKSDQKQPLTVTVGDLHSVCKSDSILIGTVWSLDPGTSLRSQFWPNKYATRWWFIRHLFSLALEKSKACSREGICRYKGSPDYFPKLDFQDRTYWRALIYRL